MAAIVGGLLAALLAPAAASAAPSPFGLSCSTDNGVRFCPGSISKRVPSWDGTPLDVDVTLPPSGDGPWPTMVLLHGLGGQKRQLEPLAKSPGPGRGPKIYPSTHHYNNVFFAREGYAVLSLSLRGFGDSCGGGGTPASKAQAPPCDRGFVRLADVRYEARDAQHLLGLLVDQGVAKPRALGATGFSYGGGIAVQLGYLRDRIRCAPAAPAGDPCAGRSGAYARWTSPRGTPLEMTAVYGQWLWSDLIASLLPNGRFLDFDPATNDDSLAPLGVLIQSYANGLFGLAEVDGYVVPPQPPGSRDAPWDLTTALAQLNAGEPYGQAVRSIAREFQAFHGGYGVPDRPAAMLLESGWNDDVFPPAESLRVYNDIRSRYRRHPVALLMGDYGHARAGNKSRAAEAFNDAAAAFFREHLLGKGRGPRPGSVIAYTSTCPTSGPGAPPDGGPFKAPSWDMIHTRSLRMGRAGPQSVRSSGGDPQLGLNFDPIPTTNPLGTGDPCKAVPARDAPGTATYKLRSEGFTLLGLPTVRATVTTAGPNGQLAARLWDVLQDGRQRLVTRGVYRLTPDQSGPIVFQLHGNGYEFRRGHTLKLELAPSDSPQFRTSNGSFTVEVRDLALQLPLASPCSGTVRLRRPRIRRGRIVRIDAFVGRRRIARLRGRRARRRTIVLRGLRPGRVRVRLRMRVRGPGGRVRIVTRRRVVRVCRARSRSR